MRARFGEAPRTMTQKLLAARGAGASAGSDGEGARVRVEQLAVTQAVTLAAVVAHSGPARRGLPELAVAYLEHASGAPQAGASALAALGFAVARPGAGVPEAVHLERFSSPARVLLTDAEGFASQGGVGLLALRGDASAFAEVLATGAVSVPHACSMHLNVTGRVRAFVSPQDVALELVRAGLAPRIRALGARAGGAVVVEVGGSALPALSIHDRAAIAAIGPALGALAVLFPSDERTVAFLRDQRRAKAHHVLAPDPGATYDAEATLELGAVDPLVLGPDGAVRPTRELAGAEVSQVILGGDVGVTARDFAQVAALLRGKRIPDGLELLLAPPSRQVLQVIARIGALAELLAIGGRLVEPSVGLRAGALHPAVGPGLSLVSWGGPGALTGGRLAASPATLALAVASGKLGDPRAWKRPPRVLLPRSLPTEDALLVRARPGPSR